jgi:hypothetical protein
LHGFAGRCSLGLIQNKARQVARKGFLPGLRTESFRKLSASELFASELFVYSGQVTEKNVEYSAMFP